MIWFSQKGHWTYECKNQPAYKARPSRTQQLLNPKVRHLPHAAPPRLNGPASDIK